MAMPCEAHRSPASNMCNPCKSCQGPAADAAHCHRWFGCCPWYTSQQGRSGTLLTAPYLRCTGWAGLPCFSLSVDYHCLAAMQHTFVHLCKQRALLTLQGVPAEVQVTPDSPCGQWLHAMGPTSVKMVVYRHWPLQVAG